MPPSGVLLSFIAKISAIPEGFFGQLTYSRGNVKDWEEREIGRLAGTQFSFFLHVVAERGSWLPYRIVQKRSLCAIALCDMIGVINRNLPSLKTEGKTL